MRALEAGEPLPVSLKNEILYAVGPSPPKPGQIIGSAGPTTTARMARFLPTLFAAGVRAVIGKGELHGDEMTPFLTHGAVYFAAIGGLGALLAKQISSATVVGYDDLGPEAAHHAVQADERPQVAPGPHLAPQARHGDAGHTLARREVEQVPLTGRFLPDDEPSLIPSIFEAGGQEDHVNRRTSNVQPGEEPQHPYPASRRRSLEIGHRRLLMLGPGSVTYSTA